MLAHAQITGVLGVKKIAHFFVIDLERGRMVGACPCNVKEVKSYLDIRYLHRKTDMRIRSFLVVHPYK